MLSSGFLLQAQINQRLQRVAALERDKTALETEVNAAKEEANEALQGLNAAKEKLSVVNTEAQERGWFHY